MANSIVSDKVDVKTELLKLLLVRKQIKYCTQQHPMIIILIVITIVIQNWSKIALNRLTSSYSYKALFK